MKVQSRCDIAFRGILVNELILDQYRYIVIYVKLNLSVVFQSFGDRKYIRANSIFVYPLVKKYLLHKNISA